MLTCKCIAVVDFMLAYIDQISNGLEIEKKLYVRILFTELVRVNLVQILPQC